MSGIRWGYALNQWDTNIDDFVRRRAHERAFKTVSISGFSAVELTAESFGPWEPLGTPKQIANLYGSLDEFRDVLRSCALEGVSSYVYDPFVGFDVEMGRGHDPLAPGAQRASRRRPYGSAKPSSDSEATRSSSGRSDRPGRPAN